jgi:16S rRNA (cytidine1402-2'-O)-methyltransferase
MIYPVPGPSAVITALMASGFEASRFSFLGFLPAKDKLRRELSESVKDRQEPLIVFIPPHKLIEDLTDLSSILGPRPAFMGREMTKFHEEYLSLDLESLLAEVTANPRRGEVTLVIGPSANKNKTICEKTLLNPNDLQLIEQDARPTKEAAICYAKIFGWPRKAMYDLILEIKGKSKTKTAPNDGQAPE